jgi:hypothetical protein
MTNLPKEKEQLDTLKSWSQMTMESRIWSSVSDAIKEDTSPKTVSSKNQNSAATFVCSNIIIVYVTPVHASVVACLVIFLKLLIFYNIGLSIKSYRVPKV